jgi:hypothetical protein
LALLGLEASCHEVVCLGVFELAFAWQLLSELMLSFYLTC